jgi:hypothetical protein
MFEAALGGGEGAGCKHCDLWVDYIGSLGAQFTTECPLAVVPIVAVVPYSEVFRRVMRVGSWAVRVVVQNHVTSWMRDVEKSRQTRTKHVSTNCISNSSNNSLHSRTGSPHQP